VAEPPNQDCPAILSILAKLDDIVLLELAIGHLRTREVIVDDLGNRDRANLDAIITRQVRLVLVSVLHPVHIENLSRLSAISPADANNRACRFHCDNMTAHKSSVIDTLGNDRRCRKQCGSDEQGRKKLLHDKSVLLTGAAGLLPCSELIIPPASSRIGPSFCQSAEITFPEAAKLSGVSQHMSLLTVPIC